MAHSSDPEMVRSLPLGRFRPEVCSILTRLWIQDSRNAELEPWDANGCGVLGSRLLVVQGIADGLYLSIGARKPSSSSKGEVRKYLYLSMMLQLPSGREVEPRLG